MSISGAELKYLEAYSIRYVFGVPGVKNDGRNPKGSGCGQHCDRATAAGCGRGARPRPSRDSQGLNQDQEYQS